MNWWSIKFETKFSEKKSILWAKRFIITMNVKGTTYRKNINPLISWTLRKNQNNCRKETFFTGSIQYCYAAEGIKETNETETEETLKIHLNLNQRPN